MAEIVGDGGADAARLTSEWKAATVCGSDVGSTRDAVAERAAAAGTPASRMCVSVGQWSEPTADARPKPTPG